MLMMSRGLLVYTSVAMEIRESTRNIVPVLWYCVGWLPGVTVHADVIKRVRSTQPELKSIDRHSTQLRTCFSSVSLK